MLRELDINEMNAVSGGMDEIVVTGTRNRYRNAPSLPRSNSIAETQALAATLNQSMTGATPQGDTETSPNLDIERPCAHDFMAEFGVGTSIILSPGSSIVMNGNTVASGNTDGNVVGGADNGGAPGVPDNFEGGLLIFENRVIAIPSGPCGVS